MARTHLLPKLTVGEVVAFMAKINFGASDECWPFGNRKGYGSFKVGFRSFRASRISLHLFAGFDPMEKIVCHKCDNPPCVNPTHLYAGTCKDNSLDMTTRNRHYRQQKGMQTVIRAKYLHSDFVTASQAERDLAGAK